MYISKSVFESNYLSIVSAKSDAIKYFPISTYSSYWRKPQYVKQPIQQYVSDCPTEPSAFNRCQIENILKVHWHQSIDNKKISLGKVSVFKLVVISGGLYACNK